MEIDYSLLFKNLMENMSQTFLKIRNRTFYVTTCIKITNYLNLNLLKKYLINHSPDLNLKLKQGKKIAMKINQGCNQLRWAKK